MTKITLNDLSNLQNENTAVTKINQNNHTIEQAFDNTISRDGSTPNQMQADFDMNNHDILNIKELQLKDGTTLTQLPTSTVKGSIIERGNNSWEIKTPGPSGSVLASAGPNSPLTWFQGVGTGDMLKSENLAGLANTQLSVLNLGLSPVFNTIEDAKNVNSSASVFSTRGALAVGDFGGATYLQVSTDPSEEGSFQLTNGNYAKLNEITVTPQMFLKDSDAGNDSLMVNRFFTYLFDSKANGIFPAVDYLFKTQVTCTVPSFRRLYVSAYGARFRTEGAIKAFYITGGGYSGGATFAGFMIDHTNNADALYGWHLHQAGNVYIVEADIPCGGTRENYGAVYIEGGSYWNVVENAQIYTFDSAQNITFGILVEGYANATQIIGCKIAECSYPVYLASVAAVGATDSYAPNGVLVDGCSIEACVNGVTFQGILGDYNTRPLGLRITNNRVEQISSSFLNYLNVNQESDDPTYLEGNMLLGVNNYINNPNGIFVNANDLSKNLRGVANFAGTSCAVTFPTAEINNKYVVNVQPTGTFTWYVDPSSKTTSGFTITTSVSLAEPVPWTITRA